MRLKILYLFLLLSFNQLKALTVVDIIVNSPDHNTLEAAVIAAGLAPTLSGAGPFTVFAPTDAAFAALPAGTVQALLADPTGQLSKILLYHAVAGKALSGSLSNGQTITTINGQKVTVTINANGVFINNAKVIVADIEADNGVVHVIDAVLIPSTISTKTVSSLALVGLYPVPARERLFFTELLEGENHFQVIDLNGKLILEGVLKGDKFIETEQLSTGTYILQINNGKETRFGKFVKL